MLLVKHRFRYKKKLKNLKCENCFFQIAKKKYSENVQIYSLINEKKHNFFPLFVINFKSITDLLIVYYIRFYIIIKYYCLKKVKKQVTN